MYRVDISGYQWISVDDEKTINSNSATVHHRRQKSLLQHVRIGVVGWAAAISLLRV